MESQAAIRDGRDRDDPVLSMIGVGKQLWRQESGDSFVGRLRSEALPAPPIPGQPESAGESAIEAAWRRIEGHQGEEFHTSRGLPFTFEVEGSGIWFFREGRRINRKLTRTQAEAAIARCPLASTTEIKDLMDFAYLFALLMDPRIRSTAW
jgi:hypothetical protein